MSYHPPPSLDEVVLRLSEEFSKCVNTCNLLYSWYIRREGRYRNDDTAREWLQIINSNFERAKVLYYVRYGYFMEDGSVPGIVYTPGPPTYKGKTT